MRVRAEPIRKDEREAPTYRTAMSPDSLCHSLSPAVAELKEEVWGRGSRGSKGEEVGQEEEPSIVYEQAVFLGFVRWFSGQILSQHLYLFVGWLVA